MERAAAKFLWDIWKNNSPGTPSTYGKMNYRGIDVKILGYIPSSKEKHGNRTYLMFYRQCAFTSFIAIVLKCTMFGEHYTIHNSVRFHHLNWCGIYSNDESRAYRNCDYIYCNLGCSPSQ